MSDDVASAPELVWEYEGGRLRRARPGGQAKKTDGNRTAPKDGSGDQRDPVLARGRTTLILRIPTTSKGSPSMQQQPAYGSAASMTSAQPRTAPGCWSTACGRAA